MNREEMCILVVGAGTMGSSMAQVFAAHGYRTYMSCRREEHLEQAKQRIETAIDGMVQEGLADESYRANVRQNLHVCTTARIPEFAGSAGFVMETIAENPAAKRELFQMLSGCCRADCVFCSNTSGMDVFSVCEGVVTKPERLIIAHWFNPPHLMKLIEVVRGPKTSDETVEKVRALLESVGKKPAVLNHFVPGFIVNRLATVINRELYSMIGNGWISAEDAENAIRYTDGLRYGFEGPLAIWDFVGLDITMTVSRGVLPTLCNDSVTLPFGEELLKQGKTGVRAGEGALKWKDAAAYEKKRNRRIIQMTKVLEAWDEEDKSEE